MQKFYSIPKGLPTKIAEADIVKPIAYYYQLKSLYVGGVILNWKYRKKEIAAVLNVSMSSLYNHTQKLIDLKLAKKEGNNLVFVSEKKLLHKYGIKTKFQRKKRTVYFIQRHEPLPIGDDAELHIKGLVIKENEEKQKFVIKSKIIESNIRKSGTLSERTANKLRQNIKKNYNSYLKHEQLCGLKSITSGETPEINPNVCISRHSIAKKLSRKAKSTGHRIAKKLSGKGIIKESRQRLLRFTNVAWNQYLNMIANGLNSINYHAYERGKIYLIQANRIEYAYFNNTYSFLNK
jgi:predicted transcriptional regulator